MKNSDLVIGIKDVAKAANVALATVDRVIHDRKGVSKKTKEKVLKVIEELGYRPNIMASNLSKGKTFVFGVLLPKVSKKSSYWEFPLKGIKKAQEELRQYAVRIEIFLYDQEDAVEIRKQILKIINSKIDGLVLTSKFPEDIELLLQDCEQKKLPYVFIDSFISNKNSLCNIYQPSYESGQLAAQLFNYCFIEGEIVILHFKDAMDSELIIDAKVKGMEDFFSGIGSSVSLNKVTLVDYSYENIKQTVSKLLNDNTKINGFFIPNSKTSHIAKYLDELNHNKVYLIGYDHLNEDAEFMEKGIIDFVISQRPEEQGYKSIMKLFEYIVMHKEVEKVIIIPLDIVTSKNYKYY